ncbi:hypothetical protein KIP88_38900 [Bradyrhizobium sp. SRL28]|nr:hypothetical protein [Bradyrhizobium sp. SRL28]
MQQQSFSTEPAQLDAMGVAAEIGQDLGGSAEGPLGVHNPVDASHGVEVGRKASGSARAPRSPKKGTGVEGCGQTFEKSVRNSLDNGLTARKKFGRLAIQRAPSGERPPPGTTQWTWISNRSRSSGLEVWLMVLVATWA